MKKLLYSSMAVCLLSSCLGVKRIGDLNMISTRNIDSSKQYELLSSYSGGTKHDFKKSRATSIESASEDIVKSVPGGEYLMNVKVYVVNGRYYAIEGDVYGIKGNNNFKGFNVGDIVIYKVRKKFKEGKISALKTGNTCIVEVEDGKMKEMKYTDITKK